MQVGKVAGNMYFCILTMKAYYILLSALVVALAAGCRQARPEPRPTIPLVLRIAEDTTAVGRVAAQAGAVGADGHIALLGEKSDGIRLARRFQSVDFVDNIDGRTHRDSLPDFAGETFDVLMDVYNEPYAHFFGENSSPDSLREAAVQGAMFAWDTVGRAKMLILTSSLQAAYGRYDIDTLQQLAGGRCAVLTSAETMLRHAYDKGARNLAVWASAPVRDAGVYEKVFAEMGLQGATLSVITPDPALDVCTEFRHLLRQYHATGRKLDALLLDSYSMDAAPLLSEMALIRRTSTEEDDAFNTMMPAHFTILEPGTCLVEEVYARLRAENLFTHRISRPAVRYFITEESLNGSVQLTPLSNQYVQTAYVPYLD